MEISCVNAKRSTIDEPCCEPVSLVHARLTLTLTLFLKKTKENSEIKLLLITGRKIGHRRKERECIFPCSEATSDDLVLLFHWRSCYLVAVLFFFLPSLSFFFLACSVTNILTPSSFKQAHMKMLEKRWNVDPDHSVLFG